MLVSSPRSDKPHSCLNAAAPDVDLSRSSQVGSLLQKVLEKLVEVGILLVDAAVVKLPEAVNWFYPGSYASCPTTTSASLKNAYFAGDVVRDLDHGSWSQEKAMVSGLVAANAILGRGALDGVAPLRDDEAHVAFGRAASRTLRGALAFGGDGPSLASVPW